MVVALALLLPAGNWLLDELRFRSSAAEVVETLDGQRTGNAIAETVLLVRTLGCAPGSRGSGTAFAVETPSGTVLVTNRHVVEHARQVGVRALGSTIAHQVVDVRVSDHADVAVLDLADPSVLPPPLALTSGLPASGSAVRLVGFPAANPFTTTGTVEQTGPSRLLLELEVAPGASGSPVVNGEGRVVAQVFGVTREGLGVATPSEQLTTALAQLRPAEGC
jgi:S1-C subfamily serine protease